MLFWWPGHVKPGVVHGIGSFEMDLYATALSVAGIAPGADAMGSPFDLSPALSGQPGPGGRSFACYSMGNLLGYRSRDWKVSFSENGLSPSRKYQLHDLGIDPEESKDMSGSHPEILKKLVDEAKRLDAGIERLAPIFDQY